ncbi:Tfp pilus assembly protein, tip-associated adhesin PilY1 [Beggiatoa alba B18LD]|uniref:Tfp pilus assembly protein, tip-associated adhesin PilY1 n=1 Tax=Beggiatoa alba B18LD TaxID=395493 RepID=I3CJU3_9GAMM|nr:LamG-like jellyroll fold domain-containing protein [Beggiatoa alba]EIJ43886.1 Tfp pilus assembly protein, tip-associated adhesin PilY1 [Beggiatoa alba B18LD]
MKRLKSVISAVLLSICSGFVSTSYADDTELYLRQAYTGSTETYPNILLILDRSGSMNYYDYNADGSLVDNPVGSGSAIKRIDMLKEALYQLLAEVTNVNIGLMSFTSGEGQIPVVFPITNVNTPVSDVTGENAGVATSTTYIGGPNDDAEERVGTASDTEAGKISLNDLVLDITRFASTTADDEPPVRSYVGCFTEASPTSTSSRDLAQSTLLQNSALTLDVCALHCQKQGYRFMGVQNSQYCRCGDTYGSKGFSSLCTSSADLCAGDNTQNCGDNGANAIWDLKATAVSPHNVKLNGGSSGTATGISGDSTMTDNVAGITFVDSLGAVAVPSYQTGKVNSSAVYFNGTGGHIRVNDAHSSFSTDDAPDLELGNTGTVAFWFKADSDAFTNDGVTFIAKGDTTGSTSSTYRALSVYYDKTNKKIVTAFVGNSVTLSSATISNPTGQWHHVAVTWDKTAKDIYIYVDGAVSASNTNTSYAYLSNINAGWNIGAAGITQESSTLLNRPFKGVMDEIVLSPTMWSASKVTAVYNSGNGYKLPVPSVTTTTGTTVVSGYDQKIGLRFDNVRVPQGAVITSAKLTFTTDEASFTPNTSVRVKVENVDNSSEITTTKNNISSRSYATTTYDWSLTQWTIPTVDPDNPDVPLISSYSTGDIKTLVQPIINRSGWCGGNAMTFMIESISGSPIRRALSYDDSPSYSPQLEIKFDASNTTGCVQQTLSYRITNSNDDAEEQLKTGGSADGSVFLTSPILEMTTTGTGSDLTERLVGLRFPSVALTRGQAIKKAELIFTSAPDTNVADSNNAKLEIVGEKGSATTFKSDVIGDLSNRTKTSNKVTQNISTTWNKGQSYTIDVTNVVEEAILATSWQTGSNMAFFISGSGLRQVASYDGERVDPTLVAPRLRIIVDQTGTSFSPPVRDRLVELIKQHTPSGGTPIVPTLYESFQYYMGGKVVNGQLNNGTSTSHVAATTKKSNVNYYVAPKSNVCSQNHVVLLTDGAANGNGAEAAVKTLTKKSSCQATFAPFNNRQNITLSSMTQYRTKFSSHELCGVDMAEYMNKTDVDPNIDGSNLTLHTIGLSLRNPFYNRSNGGNGAFGMYTVGDLGNVNVGGYSRGSDYQNSNCSTISSYYCNSGGAALEAYYYQEWTGMSPRDQAMETARKQAWDKHSEVKFVKKMQFTNNGVKEDFLRGTANRWVKQADNSYKWQSTEVKYYYILYEDLRESALSDMAIAYLYELAKQGGGDFYYTQSVESLLNAFRTIVAGAVTESATFAAPSISVSSFNRLYHRNEVYFASFKPQRTHRWAGNVKKYLICEDSSTGCSPGELLDANGQRAACDSNYETDDSSDANCIRYEEFAPGNIKSTASSFWGKNTCTKGNCTTGDGNVVTKGGAGVMVPSYSTRNIGTCLADSCTSMVSITDSSVVSALATANTLDNASASLLADWIRGKDVKDEDSNTVTDENRWAFADPLHSSPTSVTFGTASKYYTKLFVGTNDGLIHMINAEDGKEEWAFLPKELFGIQNALMLNKESLSRIYGVDSTAQFWINDNNQNGVIETASGDFVRMYIGMRRGGKNIYAFDLSYDGNGTVTPKLIWTIKGGTGDFSELAYTWSAPKVTAVNFGDKILVTLIFGGGFPGDVEGESNSGGNAIFIVNAKTGKLIWKGGSTIVNKPYTGYSTASGLNIPKMIYGIPSEISFMDSTGDNTTDRLYVGDLGGQVWRLDLSSFKDTAIKQPIVGLLAILSDVTDEKNARKFFYAPDVARVPTPDERFADAAFDAVTIGTGNRPNPLGRSIQDQFYVLRDNATTYESFRDARESDGTFKTCASTPTASVASDKKFCTITQTNLFDVTTDVIGTKYTGDNETAIQSELDALQNGRGWFINFNYDNGEKTLASPVVLDSKVYFTTYSPPFDPEAELKKGKVIICHYPPGNNSNAHTISIDESAWSAHQAHGDSLGACPNSICESSGDGTSFLYAVSLFTAVSAYGDERSREIKEGITSDISAMFLSNGDIRLISNDPDTANEGFSANGAANDALGIPLAVQPVNAGSINQITLTPTFWRQE